MNLLFENMWLKVEGFVDREQSCWNSTLSMARLLLSTFVFAKKLQALKEDIKKWNTRDLGM